jgi:2-C-methyl-D-erythritol 4-phosphate cytidylyltransferase
MSVAALVLAGGRGERLGHAVPKAFVLLRGHSLLVHALRALAAAPEIDWLLPVVPANDLDRAGEATSALRTPGKLLPAVAGGRERQDSMRAGLRALPADVDLVAVHDAARPLVRSADVSRVVAAARASGAALLAVPVADTVKRVRDGIVLETPERSECWLAQTPQVFRAELLREALAKADAAGVVATDDAQLVERLGVPVRVVAGHVSNRKITTAEDLAFAELELARREREGRD